MHIQFKFLGGFKLNTRELLHLLTKALSMVDEKLNKTPEPQTLRTIKSQLLYIKDNILNNGKLDSQTKINIKIGLLAAREFEADDPEFADILQKVDYYFKKL